MAKAPALVDVWRELGDDAELRAALEVVEDEAYLAFNVRASAPDALRERALAELAKLPGGKFYRREQLPEHLRFRAHRRIPEVILLGDESTYYWVSILRISSILNYNQTRNLIVRVLYIKADFALQYQSTHILLRVQYGS